jgi:hypothetical protein
MPKKINMLFATNNTKVINSSVKKMSSTLSSNIKINNLRSIYMHKGGSCG